jgi:phosphoglycolate phosphatase
MAIRGVLFDKDGTLIDVTGTWVPVYRKLLAEIFPELDAQGVEAKMALAGYDPETGAFRAGSVLAGGTTRQIIDIWWPGLDAGGVAEKIKLLDIDYRDLALSHLTPLMPLGPVLAALHDMNLRLGVGTNDTELSARNHMRALGVHDHFDVILGSDSVARAKPAGDMIHAFANALDIAPGEVAMVGDNAHDIETARAGGAGLAIGVLTGNSAAEHLEDIADHVVASIADLPPLLKDFA